MTNTYAISRRVLLPIILLRLPVYATVVKEPESCGSRPCVYTIRCASQTCTVQEVAAGASSINDAQPGTPIRLEGGKTFPVTGTYGLMLKRKTGGSGEPITISYNRNRQLPESGNTNNALIRTPASDRRCRAIALRRHDTENGPSPAENYRLIGLRFTNYRGRIIAADCW